MKTVCLYFQVHQPWRLKKYRFFNMGKDHNYLDDLQNRAIMQKVARQCYLPMNALLLKLIKENKSKFRCSFSITGSAIEQMKAFAPEVLESFKELAATGCVEFLAETYSHSLASLASKEDFEEQVKLHVNLIKKEFGVKPTAFRNTELIYSDEIGAMVAGMGFRTMLAEGAKHVLSWKSPNYVSCQRHRPETAPAAAQLQALGRHRLPLLEPQLGPVAADGRQVCRMARLGGYSRRGDQPLHGLRNLR